MSPGRMRVCTLLSERIRDPSPRPFSFKILRTSTTDIIRLRHPYLRSGGTGGGRVYWDGVEVYKGTRRDMHILLPTPKQDSAVFRGKTND